MTFFDVLSLSEQGIYDVINNLGSLIPRFLFQVNCDLMNCVMERESVCFLDLSSLFCHLYLASGADGCHVVY